MLAFLTFVAHLRRWHRTPDGRWVAPRRSTPAVLSDGVWMRATPQGLRPAKSEAHALLWTVFAPWTGAPLWVTRRLR